MATHDSDIVKKLGKRVIGLEKGMLVKDEKSKHPEKDKEEKKEEKEEEKKE